MEKEFCDNNDHSCYEIEFEKRLPGGYNLKQENKFDVKNGSNSNEDENSSTRDIQSESVMIMVLFFFVRVFLFFFHVNQILKSDVSKQIAIYTSNVFRT